MLAVDGTINSLFMPCFMAGMMLVNISSLSDVSRLLTDTVVNTVWLMVQGSTLPQKTLSQKSLPVLGTIKSNLKRSFH